MPHKFSKYRAPDPRWILYLTHADQDGLKFGKTSPNEV